VHEDARARARQLYADARAIADLQAAGRGTRRLTLRNIARRLDLDREYTRRLSLVFTRLEPGILAAWARGDARAGSLAFLSALARCPAEDQAELWRTRSAALLAVRRQRAAFLAGRAALFRA
jgi:hypothetical protein